MAARAAALAAVHGLGGRSVLPDALRAGPAADATQDARPRPSAQLDRGMAAAGLRPFWHLRVPAAGGRLRAVARGDTAGGAGAGGARPDPFCAGAAAQCRLAGHAGAPLFGGAAGAADW